MVPDLTLGGRIAPPSFQSLFLRMKFGDTHLASGTGFLVQTHTGVGLVTARHNLTGRDHHTNECLHQQSGIPDRIEIFHNGFTPESNESRTELLLSEDGIRLWLEHSKLGELCDVAYLPLQNTAGVVLAPYSWQRHYSDIEVKVAETVSVVGFPLGHSAGGMLGVWCTGYIASEPTQDYAGQPKFLIDCRTRKGQSGSPVIAYRNGAYNSSGGALTFADGPACRPLGVYTGRIHPDADIGVVWKWSVVEDLMIQADLKFADKLRATTLGLQFGLQ